MEPGNLFCFFELGHKPEIKFCLLDMYSKESFA